MAPGVVSVTGAVPRALVAATFRTPPVTLTALLKVVEPLRVRVPVESPLRVKVSAPAAVRPPATFTTPLFTLKLTLPPPLERAKLPATLMVPPPVSSAWLRLRFRFWTPRIRRWRCSG